MSPSRDLVAAMKARNTRQALTKAIRAEPDGAAALERLDEAIARLNRLKEAGVSRPDRAEALAQVRRCETELLVIENIVRAKWGMPQRSEPWNT